MTTVRVELDVYWKEQSPDDRVRVLVRDGAVLAGYPSGEDRRWYNKPLQHHVAMAGRGVLSGLAVAACDHGMEVGYSGEDLRPAAGVPDAARCQRPACRVRWND